MEKPSEFFDGFFFILLFFQHTLNINSCESIAK